jgi:hypothetical protein
LAWIGIEKIIIYDHREDEGTAGGGIEKEKGSHYSSHPFILNNYSEKPHQLLTSSLKGRQTHT